MSAIKITLLSLLGLGLLGASGCNMQQVPPPVDLQPFSDALRFLGACSVLCSAIWGVSLVITSRHRQGRNNQRR